MNELRTFTFGKGSHLSREQGLCVMEAVAMLAGEAHSDSPACADPAISKLAIWVNDSCDDKLRNELLRDLPWRIVGTKATAEIEQQRAYMAADWALRFVCPIILRRAGLKDHATTLESLGSVVDQESATAAYAAASAAYAAAHAAAYAAAHAAANAAYAAAHAAYATANAGASAAASAAYAAANDLEVIQRGCVDLIDRMIRITEPQERICDEPAYAASICADVPDFEFPETRSL